MVGIFMGFLYVPVNLHTVCDHDIYGLVQDLWYLQCVSNGDTAAYH